MTSPIALEFPIGRLLAGRSTKTWVLVDLPLLRPRIERLESHRLRLRWLQGDNEAALESTAPIHQSRIFSNLAHGELDLAAPSREGEYTVEIDLVDATGSRVTDDCLSQSVFVSAGSDARAALMTDVRPLSYAWGTDRGLPPHRHYLERFLESCSVDVQGRCLEFQNPAYAHRLGGKRVSQLDILHIDDSNPLATIVADLTQPNEIPSDSFDCIICTHVLHMIFDLEPAVRDLHRILKPKGVLLVAVPHVSGYNSSITEFWRFTVPGLQTLLSRCFPGGSVEVKGFGNSLIAAGDLRGMTVDEFSEAELSSDDPCCPAEICARAIKGESG